METGRGDDGNRSCLYSKRNNPNIKLLFISFSSSTTSALSAAASAHNLIDNTSKRFKIYVKR